MNHLFHQRCRTKNPRTERYSRKKKKENTSKVEFLWQTQTKVPTEVCFSISCVVMWLPLSLCLHSVKQEVTLFVSTVLSEFSRSDIGVTGAAEVCVGARLSTVWPKRIAAGTIEEQCYGENLPTPQRRSRCRRRCRRRRWGGLGCLSVCEWWWYNVQWQEENGCVHTAKRALDSDVYQKRIGLFICPNEKWTS